MKYLKLIRLPNILMIIIAQCIIKYGFFTHFEIDKYLSDLGFLFLVLATALIAIGGYIINDIYDIQSDKINKPKKRIVDVSVSEKQARLLYYIFTYTGLGFAFILSATIGKPLYILIFICIAIILYGYSRYLKKVVLVGNILISLVVGLAVLIVGIFELIPLIDIENQNTSFVIFNILKDIAIFAFIINLLREIVKDIEDMQGDYIARYKTLPIVLGAKRTAQLTSILGLIGMTLISLYTFSFLYNEKWTVAIVFFGIIAPLGYVCAQLWEVSQKKQFSRLSLILKLIMFIGICAIPLISYAIDYVS